MASVRTEIIDAIRAAVVASAVSGARVTRGRQTTVNSAGLPETFVYPLREDAEAQTMGGPTRLWERKFSVMVDHYAKAATAEDLEEGFEATEDLITAAVLPITLGVLARDILLTSTEWLYNGKENEFVGCVRLTFSAVYYKTQ